MTNNRKDPPKRVSELLKQLNLTRRMNQNGTSSLMSSNEFPDCFCGFA
jgi:hypothetical protein